jgi:Holliday junction resolvase RusA-like endonuclease
VTEPFATLSFVVPGPPVPKARARTFPGPGGHMLTLTPRKTARYERQVAALALLASMTYLRRTGARWPFDAPWFRLSCRFYCARNQGDLSNFVKSIEDALNAVVWTDDRAVKRYGVMEVHLDRALPRAEITVEAFT